MVFEIKEKIALITGGASGIGLHYAKELLRNGAKGVTLADLNPEFGNNALKKIEDEFGTGKAIYVQTDVTNAEEFENAFLRTIEKFKYIDILINNAGILNDSIWEKEINVNFKGTVNGINLAMHKYLLNHRQGSESLVVNVASMAAFIIAGFMPVYVGTKLAVVGLTRSIGIPEIYAKTHVRVVAVCPGVTWTPLIYDLDESRIFNGNSAELLKEHNANVIGQQPEFVAKEVMRIIRHAPNGTAWIVDAGHPAYQYKFTEVEDCKKNVLKEE